MIIQSSSHDFVLLCVVSIGALAQLFKVQVIVVLENHLLWVISSMSKHSIFRQATYLKCSVACQLKVTPQGNSG